MPFSPDPFGEGLLTAVPLLSARTAGAMAEGLRRAFDIRAVDFDKSEFGFYAQANQVQLTDVALNYCRYDTPVDIQFGELPGFRQFFCLTGSGRLTQAKHQIELSPTSTGILPPDSAYRAAYGHHYAQLVVQFGAGALERNLALLQGDDRGLRQLRLPVLKSLDVHRTRPLRQIAFSLAGQFEHNRPRSALMVRELEQALIHSFLFDNLMAFPALAGAEAKAADHRSAQRLEDHIQANWDRPLTIEDVAKACGVSVRSVFIQFKQRHGVSPSAYIRKLRMDNARLLLQQGDASVLDIAIRCGFASFGHFARRYREQFGELPSETLAAKRRL